MRRAPWVLFLTLVAAAGCVGDGVSSPDSGSGPGSDGGVREGSCLEACAAKAEGCGAPAEAAALECEGLCGGGATSSQLDCLGATSCGELTAAFVSGGSVCGLGGPSAPDDGGVDGGDGGTPSGCTIGDRRCPEDFLAFRCEEIAGRPAEVTERCPSSLPCEGGWCVDATRPGLGSTCVDATDCRAPARCESGLCCNPLGEVCVEDPDCCEGTCQETSFGFRACR